MATLALCIPAYNAAAFLPRLLQSAKKQLMPFDEILVYNDCSTDNTAQVAQMYGAKVIAGDVNRGCSYGKNALANITFCEWIHFHDADDDILPDFTTLAYKWINSPNCPDIVLFNYEYRDYYTKKLLGVRHFNKEALHKDPISYALLEQINPFCGLYRKQSFISAGGYDTDPQVLYNEDSAFHIKMAIANLKFSVEEKISIINYRVQSSMSAANAVKCLKAQYHVLEKAAISTGSNYSFEISSHLWGITPLLAQAHQWEYVKRAISLCRQLNYSTPPTKVNIFKILTFVNPFIAVWLREKFIRLLKPSLRKND